jgi:glutamate synthase (NADPH/NADH) small chain
VAGDVLVDAAPITAAGKRVIILGGGDTGSDCLGTAHRQGAAHVTQIELLPTPPMEREAKNPWPQWPLVFRTSSSQEEGGDREFALMTTRLDGDGGVLRKLHAIGVNMDHGRPIPIAGSERTFEVDLLILAMGFVGPDASSLCEQLGVRIDARSNIATDAQYATNVPGVFAAGDARRGQSLIVWAITEGREAARAIDAQLSGRPSSLPARGGDHPFGGR